MDDNRGNTSELSPLVTPEDDSYNVPFPADMERITLVCGLPVTYHQKDAKKLCIYALGSLASIMFVVFIAVWYSLSQGIPPKARGVILMISDGFGPASQTMARNYYQRINNLPVGFQLPLDTILVGSSRTRSGDSLVTDSAAGATAFSCGIKTYNGAISVGMDRIPCGTVLEAAKEKGMFTGLVATSRITHATPAAFSSHVASRASEADIALHQIGNYTLGRRADLLFGGGACFFLPQSDPASCREDSLNVYEEAATLGWRVSHGRSGFDSIQTQTSVLPLLNLFTPDHMSYEIDRDPTKEPSLKEMAMKAIGLLDFASKDKHTGFFLMIEGSRIDMAGHTNDPAAHVHEILAYNEAVDAVKEFVSKNPDVVVISVSDHETGGLSDAVQSTHEYPIYDWYPDALVPVQHSGEFIAQTLLKIPGDRTDFARNTVIANWLNITIPAQQDIVFLSNHTASAEEIENYVGKIVSRKAGLGW